MLLHCVFCALRPDAEPEALRAVMEDLAALRTEVEGMLDFRHGPNRDYEGKSARFGHGFVIAFRDRAAHLAYDAHPRHKDAGGRLVALCDGGHEGITVYDLETGPAGP
ncbi:Dabb family protein [Rubellimicrobium roseum]|uniref:Dabb family protein n=1 Tax=Rubellimicrobium roseum TaxID=687525 RepID=A0A5C4NL52_9RHOB|nr:Dabb family protein [Rubellimicrobium roseum]TNC74720.1 Dabb family protein [Rubellimicrobium roseum]